MQFGGNAQCITRNRFAHHTSFLYDFLDDRMEYLLVPSSTRKYREMGGHIDLLCRLKYRYLPLSLSLSLFFLIISLSHLLFIIYHSKHFAFRLHRFSYLSLFDFTASLTFRFSTSSLHSCRFSTSALIVQSIRE